MNIPFILFMIFGICSRQPFLPSYCEDNVYSVACSDKSGLRQARLAIVLLFLSDLSPYSLCSVWHICLSEQKRKNVCLGK